MSKKNKKNNNFYIVIIVIIAIIFCSWAYDDDDEVNKDNSKNAAYSEDVFKIISSTENKDLEDIIVSYANTQNIDVQIDYSGTIDIMSKLNSGEKYDAVWTSNSIWLYMLNSSVVKTSESKCTSINPVIFAIKKSKAEELGFVGKDITTQDIISAIESGKLNFVMSNPTQTNTGATAYFGLLSTIAGNPEVLKKEDIENENVKTKLVSLFNGLTRSSGSDEFLDDMFINGSYDSVVTYESSIINLNKTLQSQGKETLYALYPVDGVSISDSPFAYIDNGIANKKDEFLKIRDYILSSEGQNELAKTGRRTWYGGTNEKADKTIFNPDWGINTNIYIVPLKFPSTEIVHDALALYQTEFRKPVHIAFCLDFSGSMQGEGYRELVKAMNYILNEEEASKDLLQFTSKDAITIIPFNHSSFEAKTTYDGSNTEGLISYISRFSPEGGTDIYDPAILALDTLEKNSIKDYNCSVVLMTDGKSNNGSLSDLSSVYHMYGDDIPIFSITFGDASEKELEGIAKLTNAKVFNGKDDLLQAFKEVRGYN